VEDREAFPAGVADATVGNTLGPGFEDLGAKDGGMGVIMWIVQLWMVLSNVHEAAGDLGAQGAEVDEHGGRGAFPEVPGLVVGNLGHAGVQVETGVEDPVGAVGETGGNALGRLERLVGGARIIDKASGLFQELHEQGQFRWCDVGGEGRRFDASQAPAEGLLEPPDRRQGGGHDQSVSAARAIRWTVRMFSMPPLSMWARGLRPARAGWVLGRVSQPLAPPPPGKEVPARW